MRYLVVTLILLALTGCGEHGTYTQAFLDQAEKDRLNMRAAMKYDTAVQQFESGGLPGCIHRGFQNRRDHDY